MVPPSVGAPSVTGPVSGLVQSIVRAGVPPSSHAFIVVSCAAVSGGFGFCGMRPTVSAGRLMRALTVSHTFFDGSLGEALRKSAWVTSGIGAPNFGVLPWQVPQAGATISSTAHGTASLIGMFVSVPSEVSVAVLSVSIVPPLSSAGSASGVVEPPHAARSGMTISKRRMGTSYSFTSVVERNAGEPHDQGLVSTFG